MTHRATPRHWAALFFAAAALAWVAGHAARSSHPPHPPRRTPHAQAAAPPSAPSLVVPVHTPEQSLALFRIDPAFEIRLAAAEPLVEAPVALTFDPDGRAWVVEMRGYMPDVEGSNELEPNGRIVVLTDEDHDGVFDRRTIFMEHLVLPRAVLPCHGGALVIAPPDLIFAKDTDDDGVADQRTVLASGLGGLDNPEHAPNGLLYGLDNWIHLSQHDAEYRFDGVTLRTRPTPGHGQWGITQDDQGRLYYAPNPEALRGDLYPKHYAARHPALADPPGINRLVSPDQTVWPAIPTPAVNRGYMENVLRPDGTLASHTAACSPHIYLSSLLPGCAGDEFVCEPAAYMVRRLGIEQTPAGPVARNRYDRAEFLTSTDQRFRPVALATGPDGALYVVDMHRGVIQHKKFITPYLKERTAERGLEGPLNMGRIYRITPRGAHADLPARTARALSAAPLADLVALLADADQWWRLAAQRLLVERRDASAEPAVRALARAGDAAPVARLHALWTLEGLGVVNAGDVLSVAGAPQAWLRAAAVRLAEPLLDDPVVWRAAAGLAADADPFVRLQVALSVGESSRREEALDVLAGLTESSMGWNVLRGAVCSSLRGREEAMLAAGLQRDWAAAPAWRGLAADLTDLALRDADDARRTRLVELIAGAAAVDPGKGGVLLVRLGRAQNLDRDKPRVLTLDREPRGWAHAREQGELAREVARSDAYLAWPGKADAPKAELRPLSPAEQTRFDQGRALFATCSGCHGPQGAGTPGQIPPLAGSARVEGPLQRLAPILMHGLTPTVRPGDPPPTIMPPAPFDDEEALAAVLTFIRRSWGNRGDPVTGDEVAHLRERFDSRVSPWTEAELDAIP